MYWSIPKIWEGSTAIIIGGGPSILKQFEVPLPLIQAVYSKQSPPNVYSPYLEPLHDKHVIAVNMAYKLGDWIDVLFFGDSKYWAANKQELVKFKGLRVTCGLGIPPDKRLKMLRRANRNPTLANFGICTLDQYVCWNNNSGAAAINLAVHFGVKRIILLGFDMSLDEGNNQHWHKFYAGDKATVQTTFNSHLKGFPAIARDLKALGIECINANPESKIPDFVKMNYKDIPW